MKRLRLALAVLIAGFHAGLLGRRLAQAEMDSAVLLRWGAAFLLVAAALWLRRRGVSLLWGRQALVFWVLVLLLHAGAAASTASPVWLMVPGFALGMVLVARRGRRFARAASSPGVTTKVTPILRREILLAGPLSPRPPPTEVALRA